MSWDVVLFSSSEKINAVEDLDGEKLIEVNFNSIFKEHFGEGIQKADIIEIEGVDFTIVGYFTGNELSSNVMLNLYGENSIYALVEFSRKNDFQIFDTGIGEMINLENPERNDIGISKIIFPIL